MRVALRSLCSCLEEGVAILAGPASRSIVVAGSAMRRTHHEGMSLARTRSRTETHQTRALASPSVLSPETEDAKDPEGLSVPCEFHIRRLLPHDLSLWRAPAEWSFQARMSFGHQGGRALPWKSFEIQPRADRIASRRAFDSHHKCRGSERRHRGNEQCNPRGRKIGGKRGLRWCSSIPAVREGPGTAHQAEVGAVSSATRRQIPSREARNPSSSKYAEGGVLE